jgi:hypothetical protein|tara:strand:+ start:605 stop:1015 length:411 start_codon:yes stop_codon:yes gene_type:complete
MLDQRDLVYIKENKDDKSIITAGAYTIDSCLMNNNCSPIRTFNTSNKQTGGNVSSLFQDLAVPAGLLYLQQNLLKNKNNLLTKQENNGDENDYIPNTLFDKLIALADDNKKKSKSKLTRKQNKTKTTSKKGTKKKK